MLDTQMKKKIRARPAIDTEEYKMLTVPYYVSVKEPAEGGWYGFNKGVTCWYEFNKGDVHLACRAKNLGGIEYIVIFDSQLWITFEVCNVAGNIVEEEFELSHEMPPKEFGLLRNILNDLNKIETLIIT